MTNSPPRINFNMVLKYLSLKNQSLQYGFSMIELLIATAITTVVLVAIGLVMNLINTRNETLSQKMRIESKTYELAFYVKHTLSMATSLDFINDSSYSLNNKTSKATGGDFPPNVGKIRPYDLDTEFSTTATTAGVDTIAYFLRENLISQGGFTTPPIGADRFKKTALFFQKPTVNTFGILFLDLGQEPLLSPTNNDFMFENIVDFKVFAPNFNVYNVEDPVHVRALPSATTKNHRLSSITIQATFREYDIPTGGEKKFTWCPPSKMNTEPACQTTEKYKDVTKVFQIVFRNNVIAGSQIIKTTDETLYPNPGTTNIRSGGKNILIPEDERPYGQIYFFKTAYPVNALKRNS